MGLKLAILDSSLFERDFSQVEKEEITSFFGQTSGRITFFVVTDSNSPKNVQEKIDFLEIKDDVKFVFYNQNELERKAFIKHAILGSLHTLRCHPQDCLFVTTKSEDVKICKETAVQSATWSDNWAFKATGYWKTTLQKITPEGFTLNRYISEMELGLTGVSITRMEKYLGHDGKIGRSMYSKTIRRFTEVFMKRNRGNIVEVGTGRAQLMTAMRLSMPEANIFSYDIDPITRNWMVMMMDRYPSYFWDRVFIPQYSDGPDADHFSAVDTFRGHVLKSLEKTRKKIDFLSIDGDLSRSGIIKDLKLWLPHLSESCTIYFSGAILCHDSVKVLVDDICADFRTHKICLDFEYDAGEKGEVSISSETKRPTKQDNVRISGAPAYAQERVLIESEFDDPETWTDEDFDVRYELGITHPGMIFFEKSSNISWDQILEKVKSLEA